MDRSVLVIEDQSLIRWALAKELSTRGCRVETARDARLARRRIASGRFGVAILSIHLPDENGLNLLPLFRKRDPSTRVIVISGDATPGNKRRAFSAGAWQFIDKPFEISEILNLVSNVFGDHLDRRSHRRYWCRLPLRISVIEPLPEEASLDLANLASTCFDVGSGGMRLKTAYRLRQGQRIKIAVLSPEPPCSNFMTDEVIAEVVWCDSSGNGCTAGLRSLEPVNPGRTS
jgi:DNA-binding NarL/FixJ family response regulator